MDYLPEINVIEVLDGALTDGAILVLPGPPLMVQDGDQIRPETLTEYAARCVKIIDVSP